MSPTKRGGRRGLTRNQAEPGLKGENMQLDLSAPKVVTFKYQRCDPCIDSNWDSTAASVSITFSFSWGREVDARNPDAGLGDGPSLTALSASLRAK